MFELPNIAAYACVVRFVTCVCPPPPQLARTAPPSEQHEVLFLQLLELCNFGDSVFWVSLKTKRFL